MYDFLKKISTGDWQFSEEENRKLLPYLPYLPETTPAEVYIRALDQAIHEDEGDGLWVVSAMATCAALLVQRDPSNFIKVFEHLGEHPACDAEKLYTIIDHAGYHALEEGDIGRFKELLSIYLPKDAENIDQDFFAAGVKSVLYNAVQQNFLMAAEYLFDVAARDRPEELKTAFDEPTKHTLFIMAHKSGNAMRDLVMRHEEALGGFGWDEAPLPALNTGIAHLCMVWQENALLDLEQKRLACYEREAAADGDEQRHLVRIAQDFGQFIRFGQVETAEYVLEQVEEKFGADKALDVLMDKLAPADGQEPKPYRLFRYAVQMGDEVTLRSMLGEAERLGGEPALKEVLGRDAVLLGGAIYHDHWPLVTQLVGRINDLHGSDQAGQELWWQMPLVETPNSALLQVLTMTSVPDSDIQAWRGYYLSCVDSGLWKDKLAEDLPKHLLWQELGTGAERWEQVFNGPPPDPQLEEYSPYKFSQKVYDAVLPFLQTAARLEEPVFALSEEPGAPVHEKTEYNGVKNAYKLAVLFSSAAEAERYLRDACGKWADPKSTTPIQDALDFDLPRNGVWRVNDWKNFVLQHGPEAAQYLVFANDVEANLIAKDRPFPKQPDEVKNLVYARRDEHPEMAEFCEKHKIKRIYFDQALDLLAQGREVVDRLPDIRIDGAEIGHPGFYMEKLPKSDFRGAFLGEMMADDCCQSLGEAGKDCAVHGMTSEYGGFYVWKRQTGQQPSSEDPLVAMSWAWISQEGGLVFDSFERKSADYEPLAQDFLTAFASRVQGQFSAVRLGYGGDTPRHLLTLDRAESLHQPIDHQGYKDSHIQYDVPAAVPEKNWQRTVRADGAVQGRGR